MTDATPSLRRRLLVSLISTIVVVWLIVLALVYRAAEHEVREVFDADLTRSARILQTLLLHEIEEEREMAEKIGDITVELGSDGQERYPILAATLRDYADREAREQLELLGAAQSAGDRYGAGLIFIARYADGTVMLRDRAAPDIPPAEQGHADIGIGGHDWRIYTLRDAQTGFVVQVGERHVFRAELVRYITRNTLMPFLLALPIIALLIWAVVGRALAPLDRVAAEVSRRAPDALEVIDERESPREVRGLLEALNGLFTRVRDTIDRERRFTADAAHELRTPLAALKTHLQVARSRTAELPTRQSLDQALEGVDRATRSVEQLLILARADAEQTKVLVNAQVDLKEAAVWSVAALSQLAVERDVDLGIEAPESVLTRGDLGSLQTLLRNLVDNAVRYTPAGGKVTVAVGKDSHGPWVAVKDSGNGIGAQERAKVFNRFHRGAGEQAAGSSGSGLGLSIVARVARMHGASVVLGEGLDGQGLGVTVTFSAT
jgi:two-component system sensor histidine kinase QseC